MTSLIKNRLLKLMNSFKTSFIIINLKILPTFMSCDIRCVHIFIIDNIDAICSFVVVVSFLRYKALTGQISYTLPCHVYKACFININSAIILSYFGKFKPASIRQVIFHLTAIQFQFLAFLLELFV